MEILSSKGLPGDFRVEIVDTSALGREMHGGMSFGVGELRRNTAILMKLARAVWRFRPQIVHINCSLARSGVFRDLTCGVTAWMAGAKVLTHYHGSIPWFAEKPGLPVTVLKRLITLSQVNIASNTPDMEYIRQTGCAKGDVLFLPNYVDPDQFAASARTPRVAAGGRLRAIYVGALTQGKGVLDILEVARQRPDIDFTLVTASVVDSFKPLIASLPPNVTLRIGLTTEELRQALRESDVFVFLSYHEGFPLAVTEAMCAGLPVVATKVGSVPEMIDEGEGGFLCAPGDIGGALAALDRLVASGRLPEIGEYNRRKALANYTFDVVGPKLVDIYHALLC